MILTVAACTCHQLSSYFIYLRENQSLNSILVMQCCFLIAMISDELPNFRLFFSDNLCCYPTLRNVTLLLLYLSSFISLSLSLSCASRPIRIQSYGLLPDGKESPALLTAIGEYVKSLAGYSMICYILAIKDRCRTEQQYCCFRQLSEGLQLALLCLSYLLPTICLA